MITIYLITSLIIMLIAGFMADGLTYRWYFMDKLRQRQRFLNKKPFSCGACMSMWLTLIPLCIIFPSQEYIFLGVNISIAPALIAFTLYKWIEPKID